MACPFFEPILPVSIKKIQNGRLPLIEEYRGRCANRKPDIEVNDRSCNQGYARGVCGFFPSEQKNRANRYSLVSRSDAALTLLYINEEESRPPPCARSISPLPRIVCLKTIWMVAPRHRPWRSAGAI